jgi:hypothetical protein
MEQDFHRTARMRHLYLPGFTPISLMGFRAEEGATDEVEACLGFAIERHFLTHAMPFAPDGAGERVKLGREQTLSAAREWRVRPTTALAPARAAPGISQGEARRAARRALPMARRFFDRVSAGKA